MEIKLLSPFLRQLLIIGIHFSMDPLGVSTFSESSLCEGAIPLEGHVAGTPPSSQRVELSLGSDPFNIIQLRMAICRIHHAPFV